MGFEPTIRLGYSKRGADERRRLREGAGEEYLSNPYIKLSDGRPTETEGTSEMKKYLNGRSGPIMISEGTLFSPGALFMELDLARELDQMAAKHHRAAAQPT
jgi:hypothetical protein